MNRRLALLAVPPLGLLRVSLGRLLGGQAVPALAKPGRAGSPSISAKKSRRKTSKPTGRFRQSLSVIKGRGAGVDRETGHRPDWHGTRSRRCSKCGGSIRPACGKD